MPQNTFLNLSAAKRKEIINVSLEEFSKNDFESASLTNIIKRLGIAKGSFYRYFVSKEELYSYLVGCCRELFTINTEMMLKASEPEFADLWFNLLNGFKKKENEYPMIIRFWLKAAQDKVITLNSPERNLAVRNKLDLLKGNLSERKGGPEIRTDVEADYIIMVIMYHLMAFTDYITLKYDIKQDEPVFSITEEQLKNELSKFVKVLCHGIVPGS
jgi:AcrR family transcriptional regulator